jgi:hypothetical protein
MVQGPLGDRVSQRSGLRTAGGECHALIDISLAPILTQDLQDGSATRRGFGNKTRLQQRVHLGAAWSAHRGSHPSCLYLGIHCGREACRWKVLVIALKRLCSSSGCPCPCSAQSTPSLRSNLKPKLEFDNTFKGLRHSPSWHHIEES